MTDVPEFTLFVAGRSPRSQQAIANLRRLCDEALGGAVRLTIIDVIDDPEAAEAERILVTPTLIKSSPAPRRRITGDLSDPQRVLFGLALDASIWRTDPGARE